MKNPHKSLILTGFFLLLLTGCSSIKDELGITRDAPDEFTVMKRAPLSMPPDYDLRPPRPGAPRPQDDVTEQEARTAVFGGSKPAEQAGGTSADGTFLRETGAGEADPNIRQTLDRESAKSTTKSKPVGQRLLGWTRGKKSDGPPATVVDPVKEAERLHKAQQEGKPPTDGETPSKEQ